MNINKHTILRNIRQMSRSNILYGSAVTSWKRFTNLILKTKIRNKLYFRLVNFLEKYFTLKRFGPYSVERKLFASRVGTLCTVIKESMADEMEMPC